MTKVVGEIAIEVGADIGPLVREMSRGTGVLDRFDGAGKKLGRGFDKLGNAAVRLSGIFYVIDRIGGSLVRGLRSITTDAAAAGDAIGDAAKASGLGTTAFQEYRFAIKEAADMTDDEFASAMVKLNKSLGEAREGSTAAIASFERIGVSQKDIASGAVTTETALAAFVKKMEETTDPATAAAMATDLFGKSGAALGSSLSGVPGQVKSLVDRARELGVVMGPDAVEAAGKFDEKMNQLGAQFEAVKMKIAEVLLPVLVNQLIPALQKKVIPAILSVVEGVGEWITWFGQLDPAIQSVVGYVTAAFAVGGPVLLAIAAVSGAISTLIAATGPIGLFIAAAALLYAAWQVWGDDIKRVLGPVVKWITGEFNKLMALIDTIVGGLKTAAQAVSDFFSVSRAEIDAMGFDSPDNNLGVFSTPGASSGFGTPSGGSNSRTGASPADGIVNGLQEQTAARLPEVAAAMQTIVDESNRVLGVQSPSTVFAQIGRFLGMGMAQGISESTPLVNTAMKGLTDTAVGTANEGVGGILNTLGGLFEGSKKISAGIALANSWLAFTEVLKDPSFIGRPWARVAAAFAALKPGLQAVKNINSARPGGTGGGSVAAPAAAASGGGGVANITLVGDTFSRGGLEDLFRQINDGLRQGRTINLVRA